MSVIKFRDLSKVSPDELAAELRVLAENVRSTVEGIERAKRVSQKTLDSEVTI